MDLKLQSLYDYFKAEYGVPGTEIPNPTKGILTSVGVDIPGFRKNNPKHGWTVHLEVFDDREQFIVGEVNSDDNCVWTRYIEIKKYLDTENYKPYFMAITGRLFFEKDYDFKTLRTFTEVIEEFFKDEKE